MKSLLVDALRQSESDEADGSEIELDASSETGRSQQRRPIAAPPDTGELTLALDDVLTSTLAGYEVHPLAVSQTVEIANPSAPDTAFAESRREEAASGALPTSDGAVRSFGRAAALTPVISGLLCCLSAAAYLSFAGIGNRSEYADPQLLSVGWESAGGAGVDGALPTAFELVAASSSPAVEAVPVSEERVRTAPLRVASPAVGDPAYPLLADAYEAWQAGEVDEAIRRYEAALLLSPRHPSALRGLGALLVRAGRHDAARAVYARLLSVDPGDATAAAVLLAGVDGGTRAEAARTLLTRFGNSAPLHAALGSALADERRWADAKVAFAEAARLAPSRADYVYNLAVVLDRLARYDEARRYYLRALELDGGSDFGGEAAVVARLDELAALAGAERQ